MHGGTWGGSEELWSQAALRLRDLGHEVFASVSEWIREDARVIELSKRGIHIETHPGRQSGRVRRIYNRLAHGGPKELDLLKRFDPDLVIISQGHNAGGFQWARFCRGMSIQYVIVMHCNSEYWWFGDELGDAIETYTGAKRVFGVSRANLDLLRLQLGDPLANAEVARSPFNVTSDALSPWPHDGQVYRMASVARLSLAAKGQDLLLQVLAQPEWRDRSVELNLFGTGQDETILRRMIKALGLESVRLRGHVRDIRSVWAENQILVLPSRYEGLPLSLVEAMWCGRPAIVTNVGGNAELCKDGETGFVASAPTVRSFAHALERAWDRRGEWQQIGLAARREVEIKIPFNPVVLFCERLAACIPANASDKAVKEGMADVESTPNKTR